MKQFSSSSSSYNCKPFIKNITLAETSAQQRKQSSNKKFFNDIKTEINNIRTDVTKLITKDGTKPLGINKSYNVVSAHKTQLNNNELIEKRLQKKISGEGNDKNLSAAMSYSNSFMNNNQKTSSWQTNKKYEQTQAKLNQQVKKREELALQFEQQKKNQTYLRDQINHLRDKTLKMQHQLFNKSKDAQNYQNRCKIISQQKQELLKIIQKLQTELKQYSGRLLKSDSSLIEKLNQKDKQLFNITNCIRVLELENQKLKKQIQTFENTKLLQIAAISKNYEEKLSRVEAKSYKQLGAGFQFKINELLDDNYGLKNKITQMQSHIQEQRIQIESLNSTLDAYETRDRQNGRGANQIQMQNLRDKVMQLQQQIDKMQSDHDFQIMKLQNEIDQLKAAGPKSNENKTFNQILKDQIAEIQNLKEKLREKTQLLSKLRK